MMEYLVIALVAMSAAIIATNLGLSQAMAQVITKVCKCHKCLAFWSSLCVLGISGCPIVATIALSLLMAYLANFAGLVFVALNNAYEKIWQRLNRKR